MSTPEIKIRHGNFFDLDSPPQKHDEITFAAARVELLGTMFDFVCHFDEYLAKHDVAAEVKALVRPGEDAPWVRGRAQRLFLISNSTEVDRGEKTFFFASFIALIQDDEHGHFGVPFQCSDCYGRSSLTFSSEDAPPETLQQRIADAFWGLLLSDPTDLDEYRDSILQSGAGVWLDFGVEDGEPFLEERV